MVEAGGSRLSEPTRVREVAKVLEAGSMRLEVVDSGESRAEPVKVDKEGGPV